MAEGFDEHRIYVGDLDDDLTQEEFEDAFSIHGEIFNVLFNPDRGFGFVSYYHKQQAQNAIEVMHGGCFSWRPVRVEWANGWPRKTSASFNEICPICHHDVESDFHTVYHQTDPDNTTVFCGGLSDITSELLEETFAPFGGVENVTCFDDFRNYGFVLFNNKESATNAICSLNDTVVDCEVVTVSWARNPQVRLALTPPPVFELGAPSTSSESSYSPSPVPQDDFDRVMSMTCPNHRTVFISGLRNNVTESLVKHIFKQYGEIEHVKLFNDFSDYGFVRFKTKVSAALAICAFDGCLNINGDTVDCDWAHRQDPDPVEVSTSSSSAMPGRLPAQPEPILPFSGLAIASVPEHDQPKVATNVNEKTKEVKVQDTKAEKKVDLQCKICMDEQVGVVFLPCGHLASCARCAQRISNCPMCRKRITGKVRTYLS